MAFSTWAFSLFGVTQSRLVSPPFHGLVHWVCNGLTRLWENTTGMTADQAARRLLGADAAHLLIALFVMVLVLFLKLTLTTWITVSQGVAHTSGIAMPSYMCNQLL